ncbi:hypothetical protein CEUSTIGMA_g4273.t1 [Chlamydomonas eustigma]|uniref:Peptidyl-prolyl cis-trans isomerase n=1 Tax=Chlamydomonas eustigma TaxID=1157962 RepID=A0A250X173_9CHLO|nr:hypothetical protein CEUSTIGMA_g4273.t1 [Chlamydomonas eustigma]|eukprot:GAX76827.1 hypothetical protein CEUSTIGMA_g4273.t1 [Chlamydomonas eustigma]
MQVDTLPAMASLEVASSSLEKDTANSSLQLPDTTITNKVYLDIGIAPTALKPSGQRLLGSKSAIPIEDALPAGRIVIGIYGNQVPVTAGNFLELVRSGSLQGTVFSRVIPGEYIQAGQQGQLKMGGLQAPSGIKPNREISSSRAFALNHSRPGTVSLSLSENDEDPKIQNMPGYTRLEFLITTGPGPVPRLDGQNIPFGKVLEGMGVISAITKVPTFRANERTSSLNLLAGKLGDDRAAGVRRKYGRPFKAVIILAAGELPVLAT